MEESLKSRGFGIGLMFAGIAAGTAAGFLGSYLAKRSKGSNQPVHLAIWQEAMTKTRGPVAAADIAARVAQRYAHLYGTRPRFIERALRQHFEENILPGIALYEVLREEHTGRDAALNEVTALYATAYEKPQQQVALFGRLPGAFGLLRVLGQRALATSFPPTGWTRALVESSDEAYAFTMHTCFYLEVLTAYGVPELTTVYCGLDDLLYETLEPNIHWQRTRTLGRGDECCDFVWRPGSTLRGTQESSA